jgi:hypothetical protein
MMEQEETGKNARATSGNLENVCFRNLAIGVAFLVIGLVFTLTAVLAWWGVPLLIIGSLITGFSIIQAMRWQKLSGIDVTCPYCQKSYRILPDRSHLLCDDCQKEIPIPRAA